MGGIRTLDRAFQPYNGLANRRLQPLGHHSWKSAKGSEAAGKNHGGKKDGGRNGSGKNGSGKNGSGKRDSGRDRGGKSRGGPGPSSSVVLLTVGP